MKAPEVVRLIQVNPTFNTGKQRGEEGGISKDLTQGRKELIE